MSEHDELDADSVRAIFNERPALELMAMLPMKELNTLARASARMHSLPLQVVRNIWCRKIWVNTTKPLWSKVEEMIYYYETATPCRRTTLLAGMAEPHKKKPSLT
mmetsp:Transcript_57491/g.84335  ORF Transcript_57491/g.84335 Transcript_57491/m.84335 type:complete len:105 (+) Transcript_57491:76-390(+)